MFDHSAPPRDRHTARDRQPIDPPESLSVGIAFSPQKARLRNAPHPERHAQPGSPEATPSATIAPGTVFIFGHGRSGTHWLMNLLDLCSLTHCRSEPNELPGSPFRRLPSGCLPVISHTLNQPEPADPRTHNGRARGPADAVTSSEMIGFSNGAADLRTAWAAAVEACRHRISDRDPAPSRSKSFAAHPRWHRYGMMMWTRRRVRRGMRLASPQVRVPEFDPPRWMTGTLDLDRARLVIKLNQMQGWIPWLRHEQPQVRVLHLIRHPGGYLSSWRRRYLRRRDHEAVRAANAERLRRVAAFETTCRGHDGNDDSNGGGGRDGCANRRASSLGRERWIRLAKCADRLSVEETELWYWRYAGELALEATMPVSGDDSGIGVLAQARGPEDGPPPRTNVHHVIFEDLARAPVEVARRAFAACDLPWSDGLARQIERASTDSARIANRWRSELSRRDHRLLDHILEDSPLRHYWTT